uniref:hypothetical protein n=1 Tax=Micromonospora acroterricola TaxID=2202421 RepID=UPI00191C31ED|nr:hypothetical protein [Micromonospora acroterricola]
MTRTRRVADGRATFQVGDARALPLPERAALRELLAARLPMGPDGSIRLIARAWAVRGAVPE